MVRIYCSPPTFFRTFYFTPNATNRKVGKTPSRQNYFFDLNISIIIPAFNEEDHIAQTIERIKQCANLPENAEIMVADGGSTDHTCLKASEAGAIVLNTPKGRARQMNAAARTASGEVLYFLHADSQPPKFFLKDIETALKNGFKCGCYRLEFDIQHWFLKGNCWFTRFDVNAVRFGDQSLFVTKKVFESAGGFREDLLMMEDQEIIHRLKRHGRFKVMNGAVITSARKYLDNGIYRMQGIFFLIWSMYYLGFSQQKLLDAHRKWIRKHKL